jgi:hypothetical protein
MLTGKLKPYSWKVTTGITSLLSNEGVWRPSGTHDSQDARWKPSSRRHCILSSKIDDDGHKVMIVQEATTPSSGKCRSFSFPTHSCSLFADWEGHKKEEDEVEEHRTTPPVLKYGKQDGQGSGTTSVTGPRCHATAHYGHASEHAAALSLT